MVLEVDEISDLQSQRMSELVNIGKGYILLAALNHAHIGAVNASALAEAFLRPAALDPLFADLCAEEYEELLVGICHMHILAGATQDSTYYS